METIKTFFIQCNRELSQIDGDDDPSIKNHLVPASMLRAISKIKLENKINRKL